MRSLVLVPLVLAFLTGAAFAQGGEQKPQIPPGWSAEDWQEYNKIGKQVGEAFQYEDHEQALPLLEKQLTLIEKAIAAVEKRETANEDEERQKKGVLAHYQSWAAGNFYNRACCFSLLEQKDKAIAALKKSIDLGFMKLDKFKIDTDLDNIRDTKEYKDLIAAFDYNEALEIYRPESAADAPVGILIGLHWSASNEKVFIERFKGVADKTKMLLVAPRAPIRSGPQNYDWRRRSDDNDTGLKKIRFAVAEAKKQPGCANLPVYLVGIGLGGDFATRAALTLPTEFKGAVQVNSYWNKYLAEDEMPKAKEAGVRIAFIHGTKHGHYEKATGAVKQLTEGGVSAKLIEFEGEMKLPENQIELIVSAVEFLSGS